MGPPNSTRQGLSSSEHTKIGNWWRNYTNCRGLQSNGEPFPGKNCLFVGAGISADKQTALPLGGELTSELLQLLLHQDVAEEVKRVFRECSSIDHCSNFERSFHCKTNKSPSFPKPLKNK